MRAKILGIDLGTTNSLVAVLQDGTPKILPVDGQRLLPSVVGFAPEQGLLVGHPARNQYLLRPEATVRSVKRHMGDAGWSVGLNGTTYDAVAISALILGRLRLAAQEGLGQVSDAVITVPAYFGDLQRQATVEAGRRAGLNVVRIINEPTAAALVYGLSAPGDGKVLVYDLGGGTFDVSVVEIQDGVTEVLATHGNRQLGGDDFDARLVDHLAQTFEARHGIDLRQEPRSLARLYQAAENAKITLSSEGVATVREEFIAAAEGKPLHLEAEITRQDFERLIEDLVERTIHSLRQALADAKCQPRDVQNILLVGGSTRIPAVLERVAEEMGQAPHHELPPDEVVALGAAVQGGIIAGEDVDAVLVDVCAHSLGIATFDVATEELEYAPVIRRNTAIPTSRSQVFYALSPQQHEVNISVYQGESHELEENTFLGEFFFSGLSKGSKEVPEVLVRFDYDVNGILHVTAQDRASERSADLVLNTALDGHMPENLPPEGKALWKRLSTLSRQTELAPQVRSRAEELLRQAADLTGDQASSWIDAASELLYEYDPEY